MQSYTLALAVTLATATGAVAQTYRDSAGTVVPGVAPLAGCSANGACSGPVSLSNPLPVTGSFSATLSGFAPGSVYAAPLSVSTTSSRVALPSGSVVVVYNTGTTPAYVQLGGASITATTSNDVVAPGGWTSFTVGSNSYLAAVTASGTTSLNLSGGSGLATGAVGGASGGSTPTGAAGAPVSAVVSVQGVSGGTAVPVSGFAPASAYATPLNVTATSSSVALPAGSTVVVYNTGSNPAYVQLGGPSVVATAANDVIQAASWMAFAVGSNSYLAAITPGATTTLNISGGSGLPSAGAPGQVKVIGSLPAGAQTIGNVGLVTAGGAALGAATAWGAAPTGNVQGVNANVLALPSLPAGSNNIGLVSAAQSGAWNIGNITGSISLPAGAATSANQLLVQSTPGNAQTTAVTIQGNANSIAVPVSAAALPLPSGAASASNQTNVQSTPGVAAATLVGVQGAASGVPLPVSGGDPCFAAAKQSTAFSGSAGQFKIVTGAAAKKTYVCHISYRVGAATAVSVIEGTGTNCVTGTAAMDGSTTAANGKPEAANGGEAAGAGNGDIMHAATAADDVCILQSGTAMIAGRVTYVQQ